ncbi:MAG: FKBP-type peptidyl-prolyl cis-trans isomerase [Bacteroidia bacterium]|jgi:FKBP-type peptidyl-prolyl cis-trans isomerase
MKMLNRNKAFGFVFFLLLAFVFSGCLKTPDTSPTTNYSSETEKVQVKSWLKQMVVKKQKVLSIPDHNGIDSTKIGTALYYVADTTKVGTGNLVKVGNTVTVKYTGMFLDGSVFDTSTTHGDGTFTFTVTSPTDPNSQVISGWQEAVVILKTGSSAAFLIPSAKAYGPGGYSIIPPYTPLIFIISVVDIKTNSL